MYLLILKTQMIFTNRKMIQTEFKTYDCSYQYALAALSTKVVEVISESDPELEK